MATAYAPTWENWSMRGGLLTKYGRPMSTTAATTAPTI